MALSDKQKAWIDYFKAGHSKAEAARLAGYDAKRNGGFANIGDQNYKKLQIYIADRDDVIASPRIATMEQINEFWTTVINDPDAPLKERLKASELRARAAGGFTDKVKVEGKIDTGTDALAEILQQLKE